MESPCILVCSIDTETGYCLGCGRTREEIGSWTRYTSDERRSLMATLPARLAAMSRQAPMTERSA